MKWEKIEKVKVMKYLGALFNEEGTCEEEIEIKLELGHKSIGAGCSNQMQVAQGQDLDCGLVQAAFGCCIPLL